MNQPFDEKRQALIDTLPLLHHHLHLLCNLKSGLGHLTPSIPDGPPRVLIICPWDCPRCPELGDGRNCPPDEVWVTTARALNARYRLYAIARSLDALNTLKPLWAQAVYWQHIEPWDAWERRRRKDWSDEGVSWMVREIPGDLVPFGPGGKPKPIALQIVEARERGATYHQIARSVGVSKSTVSLILGRRKRSMSAGG